MNLPKDSSKCFNLSLCILWMGLTIVVQNELNAITGAKQLNDYSKVMIAEHINITHSNDTLKDYELSNPDFENGGFGPGQDSVCLGAQNVIFSIDSMVEDATHYIWTLNDSVINAANVDLAQPISFPNTGAQAICVAAANANDTTNFKCKTVEVLSLDTIIMTASICEGEDYIWNGPYGNFTRIFPAFELFPGEYTFLATTENALSCSVPLELKLNVRDENDDAPNQIDTFICYDWLPFIFYDHYILNESKGNFIFGVSPVTGCDTFFMVDLNVYGGHFRVLPQCNGKGGWNFTINEHRSENISTPFKEQIEIFANSPAFSYEVRWMANRPSNVIGDSLVLELSQEELEEMAINNILTLNAKILIYYKGELHCIPTIEGGIEFDVTQLDYYQSAVINGDNEYLYTINNSAIGYQWLDCNSDYEKIPGATEQTFYPVEPGNYAVEIQFENCSDTSECVHIGSTSSSDHLTNNSYSISPNPTAGMIVLQFGDELPNIEQVYIRIIDVNGEIVMSYDNPTLLDGTLDVDISAFPAGIYIVQLIAGDSSISKKIIKQ